MLVEWGLVEQRYKAVCEILNERRAVDVARRIGVVRQTCTTGCAVRRPKGLAGRSTGRPARSPASQMAPQIEARVLELRRAHPGMGPAHDRPPPRAVRAWSPSWDGRRSIAAWSPMA